MSGTVLWWTTLTTLADHIEFGFPSNYSAAHAPMHMFKEDPEYTHHVTGYIRTEL